MREYSTRIALFASSLSAARWQRQWKFETGLRGLWRFFWSTGRHSRSARRGRLRRFFFWRFTCIFWGCDHHWGLFCGFTFGSFRDRDVLACFRPGF